MIINDNKVQFAEVFRGRTKSMVLSIIGIYRKLPLTEDAKIFGRQLLRSASSTAANYRAACRARSKAEFYAKICIVVEECDETLFWIELLEESGLIDSNLIEIKTEVLSILKIVSKTRKSISN